MKITELRIGNIVGIHSTAIHARGCNHLEAKFEIEEIRKKFVLFLGFSTPEFIDDLCPIQLTEEWLLKFGFYETSRYGKYLEFNINQEQSLRFPICKHSEKDYWYLLRGSVIIQYVHQLQNLYFALTGEELTLKEEVKQ